MVCGTLHAVLACVCVWNMNMNTFGFSKQKNIGHKTAEHAFETFIMQHLFLFCSTQFFQMWALVQMCWLWKKKGSPSLKGLMPIYPNRQMSLHGGVRSCVPVFSPQMMHRVYACHGNLSFLYRIKSNQISSIIMIKKEV